MKSRQTHDAQPVLIVSGLSLRTDTNIGKTLCALFDAYPADALAQLYFGPELPNVSRCAHYYRVTEQQLIKSGFGLLRSRCGGPVQPVMGVQAGRAANAAPLVSKKTMIPVRIARDLLWKISHWKNRQFLSWLDEVQPGVVFAVMPDTIKSAAAIRFIADRQRIPVVLFVTDDYYNDPQKGKKRLQRWYYRRLQRAIDAAAARAVYLFGCSQLAARTFGAHFRLPSQALYTPADPAFTALTRCDQQPGMVCFRYFGNVGLDRWRILRELGLAIQRYNGKDRRALLEVYSPVTDAQIIRQLEVENGCTFKGFVSGDTFFQLLAQAQVAVHVEAFGEQMIQRTRLSISTKITDYLAAGKCILAIGSPEVASMQHLAEASYQVTDLSELDRAVKTLAEDAQLRLQLQDKAATAAERWHRSGGSAAVLKDILDRVEAGEFGHASVSD